MASPQYRVGIERKILSTIVWVCILPIAAILLMGYVIARSNQSEAVQQTLLKAAQKTAEGVYIDSDSRMQIAANLAKNKFVVHAVSSYDADKSTALVGPLDKSLLRDWLNQYRSIDSNNPSLIDIYDAKKKLVLSTDESKSTPELNVIIPESLTAPAFSDFGIGIGNTDDLIQATITAPIFSPSTGTLIGYLNIRSDIAPILNYAMGKSSRAVSSAEMRDVSQLLYVFKNDVFTIVSTAPAEVILRNRTQLKIIPTHPELKKALLEHSESGMRSLPKYIVEDSEPRHNALLAYQKVMDLALNDFSVYVLVYRPTTNVYSKLNKSLLLLVLGCLLFVSVLCVNAYRDVHNNIVRPVSLLNEGAQIIRQGDFDLKLKIDTGDEIEELAMSFNKMAVALKSNIKQLANSEEKYRHLVTSLRDGIYQTDIDGGITFMNEAGMSIFGYSSLDHILGVSIASFFTSDEDFNPVSNIIHLAEANYGARMWLKGDEDNMICVEITRNRIYEEGKDEPIGLEGTIRDITKSVQLEIQARERSERISAINQIANVINSNIEAGRLYESLVAELRKNADFDYAAVTLLSEKGDRFEGRQLWPENEVYPGSIFTLDTQDSCAAWVSKEGR